MSNAMGVVHSRTAVDSTANAVSINGHTVSISFYNKSNNTDAVVKLNGGPHQVVVPAQHAGGGYVTIHGDYTSYQVVTTSVTLAVFALG
jgi:hypothetical protein